MRIMQRYFSLKQISTLYCKTNKNRYRECNVFIRECRSVLTRSPLRLLPVGCAYFSDDKKNFINLEKKAEVFKDVFEHRKEQLKDTEYRIRQRGEELVRDIKHQRELTGQRLREKSEHLVKDILETKAKVKETFEEVVERDRVYTIPNFLCVARIAMSPYLGYVILQDDYNLALGLLAFAGVTDLLDGWIARTWVSQSSRMGSFLDPLADKVLIATLFVTLTWQNLLPLSLTVLIVGRDVALVAAGFIIRYKSLPPPLTADSISRRSRQVHLLLLSAIVIPNLIASSIYQQQSLTGLRLGVSDACRCRLLLLSAFTLSRYFDVSRATAQLAPTFISKVNTAIQLLLVGTTLASPVFGFVDHPAVHALWGVTAASTVVSAVSYLVSKDTYKILKKEK